ncbi:hypothetical protein IG631_04242 [Alternaria alternata]|nr:hypothetical protein IG631_04242 [Alternaria alternata]
MDACRKLLHCLCNGIWLVNLGIQVHPGLELINRFVHWLDSAYSERGLRYAVKEGSKSKRRHQLPPLPNKARRADSLHGPHPNQSTRASYTNPNNTLIFNCSVIHL